ncbi:MAG: fibronectin type III domain-containing protein, partial [Elusimicrobia bacterium]|nr:fibronectin type III domain-containing protein [Elusimicrobiota bacterium]
MTTSLLAVILLAGAFPARAAPPESSETMILTRSAVTAGGGAPSVSDSHRLTLAVGEEAAAPAAASATRLLRPGLGQILFFPGPVTDLDARADVSRTSMTLTWTAPGYDGELGSLQAGTSYFIRVASYTVPDTFTFQQAGLAVSASGDSPGALVSTGATGLAPNTTWYLGVWTLDRTGNISTGSTRGAASTLADPPVFVASPFLEVFSASVTVRWAALPASPSSSTSEGYVVEASSTGFGALSPGGVIYSSATSDVLVTTLTVSEPALTTDKLYYFRVASLNWQGRRNYIALGSVQTAFEAQPPIPADPAFTGLSTGSIVARWDRNGNPAMTSFQLDASLSSGFSEYSSSTTFNLFAATGTLSPNTTYFFRVNATT